jgi:uncharacterized membrane protein YfcA
MSPFKEMLDFLAKLLSVGGVAGVIALTIAVSICVRYVEHGNEEIPQILSYSLSTIIGFYFGAGVSKKGKNSN